MDCCLLSQERSLLLWVFCFMLGGTSSVFHFLDTQTQCPCWSFGTFPHTSALIPTSSTPPHTYHCTSPAKGSFMVQFTLSNQYSYHMPLFSVDVAACQDDAGGPETRQCPYPLSSEVAIHVLKQMYTGQLCHMGTGTNIVHETGLILKKCCKCSIENYRQ